jgi:voltage-gated sodium channel
MSAGHAISRFDKVVLAAIAANTAVLVWGWCDSAHEELIEPVHTGFLVFFTVELALRYRAAGSLRAFCRSGWNVFDTVVIGLALLPVLMPLGGTTFMRVTRVARFARVVHSLRHVSHLRVLDVLRLRKVSK